MCVQVCARDDRVASHPKGGACIQWYTPAAPMLLPHSAVICTPHVHVHVYVYALQCPPCSSAEPLCPQMHRVA